MTKHAALFYVIIAIQSVPWLVITCLLLNRSRRERSRPYQFHFDVRGLSVLSHRRHLTLNERGEDEGS